MAITYILTGSNLGNPQEMLHKASVSIEKVAGVIIKASALYQTQAWGRHDQPDFLNQVLAVETDLSPSELLTQLLAIETELGRKRAQKNDPRIIDIDILFYDEAIIQEEHLVIPHSLLHLRRFVLVPLQEIASQLLHPVLKKTVSQLLDECADPLHVNKFYEGR